VDLDPPPPARDDPPVFPPTSATPRPLRSNPKREWRFAGNGLLISGAVLLVVATIMILVAVESHRYDPRPMTPRRWGNVGVMALAAMFALACLAKGIWLRWRAR
jgi:hypothetical protein